MMKKPTEKKDDPKEKKITIRTSNLTSSQYYSKQQSVSVQPSPKKNLSPTFKNNNKIKIKKANDNPPNSQMKS